MRHHTKDKGDIGLGFVMADLLSNGIQVALPISEHLPFDCVAIPETGRMLKLSVKYRACSKTGTLDVPLASSWADRLGTHKRLHDRSAYDALAIYCPDTKRCYYVMMSEVRGHSLHLRIEDPKSGGRQRTIRWANGYADARRMFEIARMAERI